MPSNPRILLQPEAFGLSQPPYRLQKMWVLKLDFLFSFDLATAWPIGHFM
jgi:hypothetical protein